MNTTKKVLSVLLAIIMAASISITAFAAEGENGCTYFDPETKTLYYNNDDDIDIVEILMDTYLDIETLIIGKDYTPKFIPVKPFPNLKKIIIEDGNPDYCADGNVIYNSDKTMLRAYIPTGDVTNIVLPITCTDIDPNFSVAGYTEAVQLKDIFSFKYTPITKKLNLYVTDIDQAKQLYENAFAGNYDAYYKTFAHIYVKDDGSFDYMTANYMRYFVAQDNLSTYIYLRFDDDRYEEYKKIYNDLLKSMNCKETDPEFQIELSKLWIQKCLDLGYDLSSEITTEEFWEYMERKFGKDESKTDELIEEFGSLELAQTQYLKELNGTYYLYDFLKDNMDLFMPMPETTLTVKNAEKNIELNYGDALTLEAEAVNAYGDITWYVNGEAVAVGESFTVENATESFEVKASVKNVIGEEISTETITVNVKPQTFIEKVISFIVFVYNKVVDFFAGLFGIK